MSNEFVRLKSAGLALVGGAGQLHSYLNVSVKVKNVAYVKDVRIHYRGIQDVSWQVRALSWKASFGDYDVFTLDQAPDFYGDPFVDFAIQYTSGGATHWDNNFGADYRLTPFMTAVTGGNATLESAAPVFGGTPGSSYVTGISGEILVNNLFYHKKVGIRHSSNGWASYQDVDASYDRSVAEGDPWSAGDSD